MSIITDFSGAFSDFASFEAQKSYLPPSSSDKKIKYIFVEQTRQETKEQSDRFDKNIRSTFKAGLILAAVASVIAVAFKVLAVTAIIGLAIATPVGWTFGAIAIYFALLSIGVLAYRKYEKSKLEEDPTAGIPHYHHNFAVGNALPEHAQLPNKNKNFEIINVYANDSFTHHSQQASYSDEDDIAYQKRQQAAIKAYEEEMEALHRNSPLPPNPFDDSPPSPISTKRDYVIKPLEEEPELPPVYKPPSPTPQPLPLNPVKKFIPASAAKELNAAIKGGNLDQMIQEYQKARDDHQLGYNFEFDNTENTLQNEMIGALEKIKEKMLSPLKKFLADEAKQLNELNQEVGKALSDRKDILKELKNTRKLLKLIHYLTFYSSAVIDNGVPGLFYTKIREKIKDLTKSTLAKVGEISYMEVYKDQAFGRLKELLAKKIKKLDGAISGERNSEKKKGLSQIRDALQHSSSFIDNLAMNGLITSDIARFRPYQILKMENDFIGDFSETNLADYAEKWTKRLETRLASMFTLFSTTPFHPDYRTTYSA